MVQAIASLPEMAQGVDFNQPALSEQQFSWSDRAYHPYQHFHAYGYHPYGYHPYGYGAHPYGYGVHPYGYGAHPYGYGVHPYGGYPGYHHYPHPY